MNNLFNIGNTLSSSPFLINQSSPISLRESEEEKVAKSRRIAKRIKPYQNGLWIPNQKVDAILGMPFKELMTNYNELFVLAHQMALFAVDCHITDVAMKVPITICLENDKGTISPGTLVDQCNDAVMTLIVHLDHDLFGLGRAKIYGSEEIEISFEGGGLNTFVSYSLEEALGYIESISVERSKNLDTLRELVANPPEESNLEDIEERLNLMLSEYHKTVDPLANHLMASLTEKKALYVNRGSSGILARIQTVFDASLPNAKITLNSEAFSIPGAGENDVIYPLLQDYRRTEFTLGAYIMRAVRELTLSGIIVSTERSYGGNHKSRIRPLTPGETVPTVDVPALAYAIKMKVHFEDKLH